MIQLFLLFCGTRLVRKYWWVLFAFGFFWLCVGLFVMNDAVFSAHRIPVDYFAIPLCFDGIWALGTAFSKEGTTRKLRLSRAGIMLGVALLILFAPRYHGVIIGIIIGTFIVADACFRIASAYVVRFKRWQFSLAFGVFEFLCGLWSLVPWPTYYAGAVGHDVGVLVMLGAMSVCGLSLRIRSLPSQVSICTVFSKGWPENYKVHEERRAHPRENGEEVIVHVWTPTEELAPLSVGRYVAATNKSGVISTGHAAMEIKPDVYISFYPAVEIDRDNIEFMQSLNASDKNNVQGLFQPSYEVESADWCPSTMQVRIRGLNTRNMRQFWNAYREDITYNLTSRNCASSVAKALDAGLEGLFSKQIRSSFFFLPHLFFTPEMWVAGFMRQRAEAMAWTPGILLDYVRALSYIMSLPGKWNPVAEGKKKNVAPGDSPAAASSFENKAHDGADTSQPQQ
ncbi:hypothetical protein LJC46_01370 [Desulfovibrio sp. OttesenSCG-928-G15]|nr:hypothetical protein [Desulfovibrio sp. OttesenSCG-928-G15]